MKLFTFNRHLLCICLLLFASLKLFAQRNYATSQQNAITGTCILCGVINPGSAADGNLQSYSTLTVTVGLGAKVRQDLIFPASGGVPANTPVTIKLGSGNALVDVTLLGGILLQAYNGPAAIGSPVTAATLISAISGNNQSEIIFTPTQTYDRIRVTLDAGLLGAAGSIDLYDAFYGSGPGPCNTAIDEIHGISSTILGLGVNVGGVANPQRAIDGNINTFSTLNAGVAVVNSFAQQTVIYSSPSVIGDSVRVTFATGQALINANVLTGMSVSTYLGNTSNNDSRALNSALLDVRLLDLGGGQTKVVVTFAPTSVFDRVQFRLGGGIASVLSTVDLYEIEHVLPKPVVTVNNVAVTSTQVCSGSSATLTATAVPNTVYNWYTAPNGGSPVFTGAVFTTPALTATTLYYVEAMRNGCTDASARTVVTVTINPLPAAAAIAGAATATICSGQTAMFTAQAVTGETVKWYTAATGGTPVFTGNTFTTPILTGSTNYFAEAVNANGCAAATRTQVSVTVQPTPAVAVLSAANLAVNSGQTTTITITNAEAGVTYNWYATSTGGTILFTGTSYTTPALIANTTYYVDGVSGTCTSPSRAQVTIVVNAGPDVTVVPATQAVNLGQTAVFTATSTTPNATFNWYTAATGGVPVYTGPTFTTPAITANTSYYAEAVNPATNAVSPTRASGTVTVNSVAPDIAVTPATQTVNAGQTATLTASSSNPNAVFNWYTTPTGGTSVFTGATFITPPINGNITYYAEAKDPASGLVSTTRASGTITVNGGNGGVSPDVAVNPPTQAVNSGQTATFTASSTTPGETFNWYTTPTGGSPIFTGATFTTPAITANTIYYAEAKDPMTNAVSATRATGTVTVNSVTGTPPDITVNPATQAVNTGQTAMLTASSTTAGAIFDWYTTATGGSPVFTGAVFTTPAINGNITYYAEAKDPATNAVSISRAAGTITVNGGSGTVGADVMVTPPTQSVNSGQTATFTASSTTPGQNFNWYTTATGGSPVFTGATFTTPAITANTTYYAEAQDPVSGATSPTRATGTVTVNSVAPDVIVNPATQTVNAGQTATLTASSTDAGAVFHWYTTASGGTSVFTGATFTTPPLNGNVTYYAEAMDPSSNLVSSTRASGAITVNGVTGTTGADVTVTPPTQSINAGQTATFSASSTTPGQNFNWYTTATGGTSIFTGATFTTPALTANTTYYAEAQDPVSGAVSPVRASGSVTVNSVAPNVAVTPATQTVNAGQTATLTASSSNPNAVFNWYTTPTGGTSVFTGATFITPPINGNITYYAEAKDPASGLVSTMRASGVITLNGGNVGVSPDVAVNPPTQAVNSGQTATFTASSTTPGETFNWYTTPTGGSPIFTGATFTTPAITANTIYYAEAKDPTTNAVSATRATGTVTVNSVTGTSPDITVNPATQAVNTGQTAMLTASSTTAGAIFDWYTTATGGSPVFTGANFTTPAINGNITYYAEAKDPATNAVSISRAAGTITVNGGSGTVGADVMVTPPTQSVNSGQTATFTASSTTAGQNFNWYTTATGGSPIFTGATFTTPAITANTTYYAEAQDPVSGATSPTRAIGTVNVNAGATNPDIAVSPPKQAVNTGQTATFTASSTTPGESFNWYTTPTGGTPVYFGATFTTPPVNGNVTYYAEAKDPVSGNVSTTRATGAVTVNQVPTIAVMPPTQAVNTGQTATFIATSNIPGEIFNWYITPTGGTPIFIGATFTTPPVTGNVTYYAEAKDPVTGATSTTRATGTVTVNTAPSVTVTPPTVAVNVGQTATFTATSTDPGVIFTWYTTPTGGTQVGTGPTFTTPRITDNVTYYVEAKNPVTGAVSTTRATGTVAVNPAPNITVTPPTRTINKGATTTFVASSTTPGATFDWYTTASGGIPVFTGASFTTPAINANTIYYVQATNPVTGAVSGSRAQATITLDLSSDGIYVPNAFTPNNDGKNDILYVYSPNIRSLKLTVYDQWGELQFQSASQASGWDGTYKGRAQPVGVYVYFVEAVMNDSKTITKKGTITLLR